LISFDVSFDFANHFSSDIEVVCDLLKRDIFAYSYFYEPLLCFFFVLITTYQLILNIQLFFDFQCKCYRDFIVFLRVDDVLIEKLMGNMFDNIFSPNTQCSGLCVGTWQAP
jgi:hypothetical protein